MKNLLSEIIEIPDHVEQCYFRNKNVKLPQQVPYLGMGASYFSSLTLYYCASEIQPYIASEYYYYLSKQKKPLGVLISQSGESSETIWNLDRFEKAIAIVNNANSTLAKASNVSEVIEVYAGEENFSSTKTYLNTLITLYLGLGIDPKKGIEILKNEFKQIEEETQVGAQTITNYLKSHQIKGLYVVGSGANIATACEGALTLSETTKLSWIGMPLAQYDHGPKETADDTVLVILNGNGKDLKRINLVKEIMEKKSNAQIVEFEEKNLPEELTPITLIVRLNFLTYYLAELLQIDSTFKIGGKITKIGDSLK